MESTTHPHKRTMQAVMSALAQGDGRPFADAMAEDFSWIVPGRNAWSGRYEGKQAVRKRLLEPLFAQFDGPYTNSAVRIVAEGDIVVVECKGRTTTRRGLAYDNQYCFVCRFGADGKMHELVEYMDTELVARVLEAPPA